MLDPYQALELEGYPLAPYGMGDCRSFLDVAPLIHFEDGSTCINPDFEAVSKYSISARGRDPGLPPDRNLVVDPIVPAGTSLDMQLVVEREENGMGHFLINELLMLTDPPGGISGILVEIKTLQGDMIFTNRPAPAVNVFGNAQLNCCLPCPIMLYPNMTLIFKVYNRTIPAVPVRVRIVARGKRFMPYHNMGLLSEMDQCWSMVRTYPFWLGFDDDFGEVSIAAGATASEQMSIPGGGFFEMIYPRVQIVPDTPGLLGADDILVDVTEGRVGKRQADGPISLGAHYAVETKAVAGFPGDLYRAASACNCPPPTQFFRGNTRIHHNFQNLNATPGAGGFIRLTYAGCMHYLDKCPPQVDLDLVRRYGHGDANALRRMQEQGDRIALSFLDQNPLYAESEDCLPAECQPAQEQGQAPMPQSQAPGPAPAQVLTVSELWRPSARYYGPGSTGALPHHLSFGRDQTGRVHVVVRDPRNNTFVRIARPTESPPWTVEYLAQQNSRLNGMNGMGGMGGMGKPPQGSWATI